MGNNKGFTLMEVLISLVFLSIGLLGIAGLQLTTIKGNASANLMTKAITLAQEKLETLSSLPNSDPQLNDPDWPNDDIGTNIHDNPGLFSDPDFSNDSPSPGLVRVYNVRNNFPRNGLRTITIIVGWEASGWHYHSLTTIRR